MGLGDLRGARAACAGAAVAAAAAPPPASTHLSRASGVGAVAAAVAVGAAALAATMVVERSAHTSAAATRAAFILRHGRRRAGRPAVRRMLIAVRLKSSMPEGGSLRDVLLCHPPGPCTLRCRAVEAPIRAQLGNRTRIMIAGQGCDAALVPVRTGPAAGRPSPPTWFDSRRVLDWRANWQYQRDKDRDRMGVKEASGARHLTPWTWDLGPGTRKSACSGKSASCLPCRSDLHYAHSTQQRRRPRITTTEGSAGM